jgi:competence protein ComEC
MMHNQKPPRQPMFWAALTLSLGLWTGIRAWRPPSWWAVAIAVFVLATLWFLPRRPWLARTLALATWFLFGAFLIQIRGSPPEDSRLATFTDDRPLTLTAHVIREGYAHTTHPGQIRQSIDVETEAIESDGQNWPVHTGIRLSLYERVDLPPVPIPPFAKNAKDGAASDFAPPNSRPSDSAAVAVQGTRAATSAAITPTPALPYGTRIRIRAKLHPARNFRNPGAFDYEAYLRDNGISMLGSAQLADVERLPGFFGNRIALWRSRVHSAIIAKIHQLWPPEQATLMDAMVLGEESFLRNATRTEFQRSGTYHLLVVSGMNLSILAFAIFWTLRQFRLDPALSAVTTVVVSFAYAFVVGVGPPVWRAALMLAIYLGARLLYRDRNMLNAIGAAAIGVLIADPNALFGASFQLTFLAVFIIAGIGAPLLERTTLPYARGLRSLPATSYDLHVAPKAAQLRLDLRLIGTRLSRFIGTRPSRILPALLVRVTIGLGELMFISALMQSGPGAADGLPFSSCDHHGNARQSGCHSAHPGTDAGRRGCRRFGLPLAIAGQARGLDLQPRPARHHRHRALAGRRANGGHIARRSSRCHALPHRDFGCHSGSGAGDAGGAAEAHLLSGLPRAAGSSCILDCLRSLSPAHPSGRNGDDHHRRRARRLHSARHAAGPRDAD